MQVSGRARLAWANRNLEAAADIIVAENLRRLADTCDVAGELWDSGELREMADVLDPEGEN